MVDPTPAETIDQLVNRLDRLEDERAVIARLHELTFAVDGDDIDRWIDCFTPAGRFSYSAGADQDPLLDLSGADQLAGWLRSHRQSTPVGQQTHLMLHPTVNLLDGGAVVTSTYVTLRALDGEVVVASSGAYEDHLTRGGDGSWRVAHRRSIGRMSRDPVVQKGTEGR